MKPADETFDVPEESDRRYFRDNTTGDRFYLVTRVSDGQLFMRSDRVQGGRARSGIADIPYTLITRGRWEEDILYRPLTKFQVAKVAFEADRALCYGLGLHDLARKEWKTLTPAQRRRWVETGPVRHPARAALWAAVNAAIGYLRDGESSAQQAQRPGNESSARRSSRGVSEEDCGAPESGADPHGGGDSQ